MRVGIVGSRTYSFPNRVVEFVYSLPDGTVVVSGGARGVDEIAADAARSRGLNVKEHFPVLPETKVYFKVVAAYYERNQRIVDDCDALVAFVDKETGGTWDTIRRARKKGIPVTVYRRNS